MTDNPRNQEEPTLYRDKDGDYRTLAELDSNTKKTCVVCGGKGFIESRASVVTGQCDECTGRGYYFTDSQ